MEALLIVALTIGMRRGELVALGWDDIDFEQAVVYVRRTLTRVIGHGYVETEPKTRTSRRKIILPGIALEALKEHHKRQEQARIQAGETWHEQGIVFCNWDWGFFNSLKICKHFQKILKEAGFCFIWFFCFPPYVAADFLIGG